MVEERPRPVSPDMHSALAFHSVMESGTFTVNSWPPDALVWREKDRKTKTKNQNQDVVTQRPNTVTMELNQGG